MFLTSTWMWVGFFVMVLGMLAVDLGVFQRRAGVVPFRTAALWTAVWIGLAMVFNLFVLAWHGPAPAMEFFTAWLIEKALSVDNIFVFILIFTMFGVPPRSQRRVLFWGVMGALVMRGIFIAAGTALLESFHWVIYIFGVFLIYTGIRLATGPETEVHPERNPLLRLAKRFIPVTNEFDGEKFFVRRGAVRLATPLLMVLIVVESTDLVFAVDSIPAVLAVTRDPFLVYTSNIFAILGLRALYFLLAGVMARFHYLKLALSLILCFVGAKMLITDFYKIPIAVSLGVIVALLAGAVIASIVRARRLNGQEVSAAKHGASDP